MADTVTTQTATLATIPTATVIATDDAGGSGHVQIVKLAQSADGSATAILADSNGIEIQGAGTAGSAAGGVVSVQGVASGTTLPVTEASAANSLTALQLIDDTVFADDAGFTVATSKVSVQGGLAVAIGADPDAADANDAAAPVFTRHRQPFVIGGHPNTKCATWNATGAFTDDPVIAAVATGNKIVVTRITVTLDEAATVGVAVRMGFGTANVPALGASGADGVAQILCYHPGLIPGSGFQIGDGSGIIGMGADDEDLRVTCEAPTGGTLVISVSYFILPS
jgi:hypothetical protein